MKSVDFGTFNFTLKTVLLYSWPLVIKEMWTMSLSFHSTFLAILSSRRVLYKEARIVYFRQRAMSTGLGNKDLSLLLVLFLTKTSHELLSFSLFSSPETDNWGQQLLQSPDSNSTSITYFVNGPTFYLFGFQIFCVGDLVKLRGTWDSIQKKDANASPWPEWIKIQKLENI